MQSKQSSLYSMAKSLGYTGTYPATEQFLLDYIAKNMSTLNNKAYFLATSDTEVAIVDDANSPSFLTGLELEGGNGSFEISNVDGSVKNITGRILKTLTGSVSFQPDKLGGGTTVLYFWSERSLDNINWVQNSKSLRVVEVNNNGETFKTAASYVNEWLDGEYVRFRVFAFSGGSTILTTPSASVINGIPVVGHSIIWELKEL